MFRDAIEPNTSAECPTQDSAPATARVEHANNVTPPTAHTQCLFQDAIEPNTSIECPTQDSAPATARVECTNNVNPPTAHTEHLFRDATEPNTSAEHPTQDSTPATACIVNPPTAHVEHASAATAHPTKKETVDWEIQNGPTPANMHVLEGHSDEQTQVEGAPSDKEREEAIVNAASLNKEEMTSFRKESVNLKKKKQELSVAKAQVVEVEQELGWCREPREWSIKRPNCHCGDILGNECRKQNACCCSTKGSTSFLLF
jgi:hypothetical protein